MPGMRDWMTNRMQRIPPDELRMLGELERKVLWPQFPVAKGIRLLGISLSTFAPTDPSGTKQLLLGI